MNKELQAITMYHGRLYETAVDARRREIVEETLQASRMACRNQTIMQYVAFGGFNVFFWGVIIIFGLAGYAL